MKICPSVFILRSISSLRPSANLSGLCVYLHSAIFIQKIPIFKARQRSSKAFKDKINAVLLLVNEGSKHGMGRAARPHPTHSEEAVSDPQRRQRPATSDQFRPA